MRVKTVLLTGGSGVLGRALIDELSPDFNIICMRNRKAIGDPRVSDFAGSFADRTLGLPSVEYDRLTQKVDMIVHSAAATNWKEDLSQIRAVNLGGPTALLRLASEAGAPLYFMSTAFVAKPLQEHAHFAGATTYIQSKIDAEQMVREHPADSVILRPSVISGDSIDGRMAAFQGLHRLMGSVVRGMLPMIPCRADAPIDLIPQDIIAEIVGSFLRNDVRSGEYWLTAGPEAVTANDLLDICHEVLDEIGGDSRPADPRFLSADAVDRLILPMLREVLPMEMQQIFLDLLEFTWLFQTPEPLPTSIPELGLADRMTRPALKNAVANSLRYWATAKGMLPAGQDRVA